MPPVLTLDPAHPPEIVDERADGAATLAFGPQRFTAWPAVVVTLHAGEAPPAALARARPLGQSGRTWSVRTPDVRAAVALAAALEADPAVLAAFPDVEVPKRRRDDPERGHQWYLDSLGMDALFGLTHGDAAIRVAVLDSGIDIAHPDLAAAVADPYDAHDDDDDPSPNAGEYCGGGMGICDEHGTAVSGIIAARRDNGVGIVGMCADCTLIPIKLLGEDGGRLSADVAAFEWAIDHGADVINNSWGFVEPTPVPANLAEVITRAATEGRDGLGAVVVFAAGNDDRTLGNDEMEALDHVVCVGAIDSYGNPTAYTNDGDALDVAAPSATFTIAPGGGTTETFGGTSAAAPVVSGLAAWMLSVDPTMSADDVADLLVTTAHKDPRFTFDDQGHHPVFGYGVIDPPAILDVLRPADTDVEAPKGCACDHGGAASPWLGLLGLLGLRRRVCA